MKSILDEKIAVCYTCCGPTYRESAKRQLINKYFDDDNIYYCILTDDKSYFDGIERKNLIVNELKDFYKDFPNLEKNEAFLESNNKEDYANQFIKTNYLFPFSTYRFNLLQALNLGISNIALLCTDTYMNLIPDNNWGFNNTFFNNKNFLYNTVSQWDSSIENQNMTIIKKILKDKYKFKVDKIVRIIDAAARLFIFKNIEEVKYFFEVWNHVIETLYKENKIYLFEGSYVIHDEYILAPIYNAFKLTPKHDLYKIFTVNHDQINERFWT